MSNFTKVLNEYCMIEDMEDAERFAKKHLKCSSTRKDIFLMQCEDELKMDGHGGRWELPTDDEEKIKDYIDSMRRAPYIGMGI